MRPQTPSPTLDDVWRLFQETDRRFQETDRRFQETDRRFQETERLLKEQSQETERLLKEQSQETDRRFQETDKRLREATKKIGQLGNRLGDFVEGFIKPGIIRIFQERGIQLDKVTRDVEVKRKDLNLALQIDLLAVNGYCCIPIEVKVQLCAEDIKDHIERIHKFKILFPEYQDKKIFGAVAGMIINDEVITYATRQGFFVITQKGDMAVILNEENFQPKAW